MSKRCAICDQELTYEWTLRGIHWLCIGCSKRPTAVFGNNGSVAVIFLGGPLDGQNIVVTERDLSMLPGYRVTIAPQSLSFLRTTRPEQPIDPRHSSLECYEVQYIFDWDLGFFVFKGKI